MSFWKYCSRGCFSFEPSIFSTIDRISPGFLVDPWKDWKWKLQLPLELFVFPQPLNAYAQIGSGVVWGSFQGSLNYWCGVWILDKKNDNIYLNEICLILFIGLLNHSTCSPEKVAGYQWVPTTLPALTDPRNRTLKHSHVPIVCATGKLGPHPGYTEKSH